VQTGDFLTLVGPNGAGKTTLLGIISGLIRPSRGKIHLDGVDAISERNETIGRKIGVLSNYSFLYDDLTIAENLKFYDVERLDEVIDAILNRVKMNDRAQSPVKTLSRGMQQRIAIARAMLHDPPILLLDEPYVGLDQEAMDILQGFLSEKARTVLLVTHDLNRGLEVADRVIIMDRGRIVYDTPKNGLSLQTFDDLYRQHTTSM
jgi:heme exporter protein A